MERRTRRWQWQQAWGCNAERVAKAEREYNMQTAVANIARSGMQPIDYLLR